MLAEPEPLGGFGKGSEPLSQMCPTLYPGAKSQDVRRAVACRRGGARRIAKPVGVTTLWLQCFPFDDCAIIRRFYLSAADFGNVPFRLASTVDSLLSASVGSPKDADNGAVGI